MRILKPFSLLLFTGLLFTACSSDDNGGDLPEQVNEEELITTMTVTLTPDVSELPVVTLEKEDLDGDGSDAPVVTVSDSLTAGITYTGSIILLDKTKDPAEDITSEVRDEGVEHQFFFVVGGNLDVSTEYDNNDANGNPLGTEFTLRAGEASEGTLTVTLRHEPKKPNDGTLADAGGETDADATFNLTVK